MKEIIISDTLINLGMRIVQWDVQVLRHLGLYVILDNTKNEYGVHDATTPFPSYKTLIVDGITRHIRSDNVDSMMAEIMMHIQKQESNDNIIWSFKKRSGKSKLKPIRMTV